MVELYILLILMIVGAVGALEMRDLLSSVVALGAVGLGLSFTFLILKAPDLAITQLAVEVLSVIILIRATLHKDLPETPIQGGGGGTAVGLGFGLIFLAVAFLCIPDLPPFGEPVLKVAGHYLEAGLKETGAANLVTSVILDYRAYDTLGEATVLFTVVMGILAVMRTVGRKDREKADE